LRQSLKYIIKIAIEIKNIGNCKNNA